MRLSRHLCKQHIGWHLKKLWANQSIKKIEDSQAEKRLLEKGIPVVRAEDVLQESYREQHKFEKVEVVGFKPPPIAFDNTHPNWHDRVLLTYKDNNVLLEGLKQAKILTNTVELTEGLPKSRAIESNKEIERRVKEIILSSHVFDAEQQKLPKLKDPERPAWNFPRVYGITQPRVIKLLLSNLLQLIENTSDLELVKNRFVIDDAHFSYSFEKYGKLMQFELKGDTLLTSKSPLSPVTDQPTKELELPDIFPIEPTITLNEENVYTVRQIYPINIQFAKSHPHTIFIPHVETDVKNIFEEPVTDEQIFGRSLLKTFTVAASYAKEKFGDVKILPKPVTVQCVHTNGHLFHFGVFQLNTLDLEDSGVKNVWYQTNRIPLFESCGYKVGKPVLEGYNREVMHILTSFYNNV
ncbi:large ribosomal subunit protein mL37 [Tribolium castaneum]|uniref:Large ribosomal subunit protein mL37 n=1 Tax=Tribolium castaneum TaxID=7070 RepID=D6WP57_TRICA|nr:PREDICTED: 39S ribosomal protein L37, mitochondrial [Tribolium castaneum]EFA07281.1 39S ribosomal protein L37, mitochondrial-like Protein [Tribolium castaneum]|eukprot:XP_971579.2 PREDICTED: 39S ribosomal protein L37, mitochondrial [Tribolium castaneum]